MTDPFADRPNPAVSDNELATQASELEAAIDDLVSRYRTKLSAAVEAKQYARANHLRTRISRLGGLRLDLREALTAARRDPAAAQVALGHLARELSEIGAAP